MAASPALALAAAWVRGGDTTPDFLPPKVQPWQQLVSKGLSPRKLIWAGEAAGGGRWLRRHAPLASSNGRSPVARPMGRLEPKVDRVERACRIRSSSFATVMTKPSRDVSILGQTGRGFSPGTARFRSRTLECATRAIVTCSGVARDNDSFVKVFGKLSDDTNEISNLHPESSRPETDAIHPEFSMARRRPPMETKNREKLLLIATGALVALVAAQPAGHFALD